MGSGFLKKKKQAKMMQEQLMDMQNKLSKQFDSIEVTGTSGNGLVQMTINGSHDLQNISIKPECVDPDDIEGLEVLIKAAYNDACEKLKEKTENAMPGGMPSGMPDLSSMMQL